MTTMSVAPASLVLGSSFSLRPVRMIIRAATLSLSLGAVDLSGSYSDDIGGLTAKRFDRLTRALSIVDNSGSPATQFQNFWQRHCEGLESAIGALATGQINLAALVNGLLETQKAISVVSQAVSEAQATAAAQNDLQRVRDSYSDPNVLTASNAGGSVSISVAAHQRHYLDPAASVSLAGGTISGLAAATGYFVYYDDPGLSGGAVTYQATTDNAAAVASLSNPYRHAVGSIPGPTQTGQGTVGESAIPPWKLADPYNLENEL